VELNDDYTRSAGYAGYGGRGGGIELRGGAAGGVGVKPFAGLDRPPPLPAQPSALELAARRDKQRRKQDAIDASFRELPGREDGGGDLGRCWDEEPVGTGVLKSQRQQTLDRAYGKSSSSGGSDGSGGSGGGSSGQRTPPSKKPPRPASSGKKPLPRSRSRSLRASTR
jgi:hypothetical protein